MNFQQQEGLKELYETLLSSRNGVSSTVLQSKLPVGFPFQNLILFAVNRRKVDVEWVNEVEFTVFPFGSKMRPSPDHYKRYSPLMVDLYTALLHRNQNEREGLEKLRIKTSEFLLMAEGRHTKESIFKAASLGCLLVETRDLQEDDWMIYLEGGQLEFAMNMLDQITRNVSQKQEKEVEAQGRFLVLVDLMKNFPKGEADLQALTISMAYSLVENIKQWGYPKPLIYLLDAVAHGYLDGEYISNMWKFRTPQGGRTSVIVPEKFEPLVKILRDNAMVLPLVKIGSFYGKQLMQAFSESYGNLKTYALVALVSRIIGGYFDTETKDWYFYHIDEFEYPTDVGVFTAPTLDPSMYETPSSYERVEAQRETYAFSSISPPNYEPSYEPQAMSPDNLEANHFYPFLDYLRDSAKSGTIFSLYKLGSSIAASLKGFHETLGYPQFKIFIFDLFCRGLLKGYLHRNDWCLYLPDAGVSDPYPRSHYKMLLEIVGELQPVRISALGSRYSPKIMSVIRTQYPNLKSFIIEAIAQKHLEGRFVDDFRDMVISLPPFYQDVSPSESIDNAVLDLLETSCNENKDPRDQRLLREVTTSPPSNLPCAPPVSQPYVSPQYYSTRKEVNYLRHTTNTHLEDKRNERIQNCDFLLHEIITYLKNMNPASEKTEVILHTIRDYLSDYK